MHCACAYTPEIGGSTIARHTPAPVLQLTSNDDRDILVSRPLVFSMCTVFAPCKRIGAAMQQCVISMREHTHQFKHLDRTTLSVLTHKMSLRHAMHAQQKTPSELNNMVVRCFLDYVSKVQRLLPSSSPPRATCKYWLSDRPCYSLQRILKLIYVVTTFYYISFCPLGCKGRSSFMTQDLQSHGQVVLLTGSFQPCTPESFQGMDKHVAVFRSLHTHLP